MYNNKNNIDFSQLFKSINNIKITKKKFFIGLGITTVLIVAIGCYFGLVPLNFHQGGFRAFLCFILAIWSTPFIMHNNLFGKNKPRKKSLWQIPVWILVGFVALNTIFSIATSPLFMSASYRGLMAVVDNRSFIEDVEDYTTMQIPIVDRSLAEKLGDKKLGEDNLGSQFSVGKYYMICHKDNLYWIAPIEFNGFFPWVNKRTSPGYVMINANDPTDVKIVKSELRYTQSAFLGGDINRKNYFNNMSAWRATDAHLELTDEGEPRYVETVYANTLGYTNGRDIIGIIVTNPQTGESEYYDYLDAPKWINHVLTEEVIIEQLNYWGIYVNGFFNSIFAKSEVLEVSTGVNYVYSNGNMYLQTGMTSVGGDESIVGVMMVDMRTKEAFFYRIGGATEYAAAQSAMGKDQEKRYSATDPIMINMDDIPTYFVMLKDDEGLVKRYAYVNVKDYNIVATGETLSKALIEYKNEYKKVVGGDIAGEEYEFTIKEIYATVESGNTYYRMIFEKTANSPEGFEKMVFRASIEINPYLPFIKPGEKVIIRYQENGNIYEISSLEVV